jgi:hypothetical protein
LGDEGGIGGGADRDQRAIAQGLLGGAARGGEDEVGAVGSLGARGAVGAHA